MLPRSELPLLTDHKLVSPLLRRIPDSTLLDPTHLDHMVPERSGCARVCQWCGKKTWWYCPGCRTADDCGAASGHYCLGNGAKCWGLNHRKRARTSIAEPTAEEEMAMEDSEDEDDEGDVEFEE